MFYKNKVLNKVYIIAIIIITLMSLLFFTETMLAKETEIFDNKPVFARAVVDLAKDVTNLGELEEDSDLIIKGIIQEEKEILMVDDSFGYTNTKVLVTEVIKGDENLINQIVIYREPYFETTQNGVSGYIMCANYLPAIINNEYILFLNNYTGNFELYKGIYSMRYYEKGKYSVNNGIKKIRTNTTDFVNSLSSEELNIGPNGGTEEAIYRDIYKSVLDKYVLNSDKEINKPIENEEITTSRESEGKTIITKSAEELGALNKNNRLLIPLRDVAELTGCSVEWDGNTKTACAKKGKNTVKFSINSNEYYINDKVYELDTQAEIYDSKTYVPLRAVSEGLGVSIEYDSDNKTVTLSY